MPTSCRNALTSPRKAKSEADRDSLRGARSSLTALLRWGRMLTGAKKTNPPPSRIALPISMAACGIECEGDGGAGEWAVGAGEEAVGAGEGWVRVGEGAARVVEGRRE